MDELILVHLSIVVFVDLSEYHLLKKLLIALDAEAFQQLVRIFLIKHLLLPLLICGAWPTPEVLPNQPVKHGLVEVLGQKLVCQVK